ncbi:T9SS type A sorting domain-containing protein [candidate division KSB1 bacterium]|nr:T9SS type A sorting domain-containing protein [candidate division KSB1 bacterium]
MKIYIILCLLFAMLSFAGAADFCVYEANYPNVKDYNVRLDDAELTITPRGAFIEMDLMLTVSYNFQSWFFKNYNELEFQWSFSLPDQVVVNDFWLWVGDSILKPTIMDKWTAELLFSEVSSPVRNPGILTQSFPNREGQVTYSLRIYPVMRNEKRKFKIHYLLPARPTNETLRLWLPTSQLTSRQSPGADSLKIVFKNTNKPDLLGTELKDERFDPKLNGWTFQIGLDYNGFVELVYPSHITNKPWFGRFQDKEEAFYQMALYPPAVPEQRTPRKFLILLDFNRFNTTGLDGELLLLSLKETMQQALSSTDFVNILVSYTDVIWGAPDFLACTEQNLDEIFKNILQRSFPAYSNFQILFATAAQYLKNRNENAEIIMLTNTDEIILEYYSRDQLADLIIGMFAKGTKIHLVDLDNRSALVYNNETSQYETQLQSFYGRLSYQSLGNLFFLRYHSIKNILAALFYEQISHYEQVEVQTRFASGYAYGKHLLALHEGYYPLRFPIIQVGRYSGSLPLDLTVLGKTRLQKVTENHTITEGDVVPDDEQLAAFWYGSHIQKLLKQQQTNATIVEIMNLSLEKNIMTPYTSFLIYRLEENQGFQEDTETEGGQDNKWTGVGNDLTSIDNPEISIKAFPNPFNSQVNITFTLPDNVLLADFTLTIYNSLGQQVRKFDISHLNGNMHSIIWNGENEFNQPVSSGIYYIILTGPKVRQLFKVVLMR